MDIVHDASYDLLEWETTQIVIWMFYLSFNISHLLMALMFTSCQVPGNDCQVRIPLAIMESQN